ncbi:sigma-70 family RNA polymerase sigma factor [Magnetospirillum aberrantis]|uniref:sigma-70 family RNA polymerase sigma factor n=1 Tax=Magnetospirillum aberrantis TaxID=1105283 RepID=UPI001F1208BC|nr:sigma-70 family RNA polymerase sigma factor [Magnetospirillum aberrantis]
MKSRPSKLSLYMTHRSSLVNYATPIVGCRARAEDIVQDAYLRFDTMERRQQAADDDAISHPVAYLYRIVRNLSLNCVRRQASEGLSAGSEVLESLSTTAPTPEREVQCREELQLVAEALAGLPERTRRAFELYRLGGHTLQQVASILGISVGLTHQLVRDAMTCCADRLGGRD